MCAINEFKKKPLEGSEEMSTIYTMGDQAERLRHQSLKMEKHADKRFSICKL